MMRKLNHGKILRLLFAGVIVGIVTTLFVQENVAQADGDTGRGARGGGYRR